jgi:hypothetical protein
MTSINFPDTPAVNDIYTVGIRSWIWTGIAWESVAAIGPVGPTGPQGDSISNIDGGIPNSLYGGIVSIDGGSVLS